jgi:hypothetical protein
MKSIFKLRNRPCPSAEQLPDPVAPWLFPIALRNGMVRLHDGKRREHSVHEMGRTL